MSIPRVLLIDPHYIPKNLKAPSLSTGYLTGSLKAASIDFDVIDFVGAQRANYLSLSDFYYDENRLLRNIQASVQRRLYTLVGITCCYGCFSRVRKIARMIKQLDNDLHICVGGPFITSLAYIEGGLDALLDYSADIDALVVGEGESIIVDIATQLQTSYAHNLTPRLGAKVWHSLPLKSNLSRIDDIPMPDWAAFDLSKYSDCLYFITSRGCPYHCHFCDEPIIWNHTYRYRTAHSVLREFQRNRAEYNISRHSIEDSTFLSNPNSKEICEMLIREEMPISFSILARFDEIWKSLEWLGTLRASGCESIEIGFETATPSILRKLKKDKFLRHVHAVIDELRRLGVGIQGSFVIGLPGEHSDQIQTTIDFAKSLNLDLYRWHLYQPSISEISKALGVDRMMGFLRFLFLTDINIPHYLYGHIVSDYKFVEQHCLVQAVEDGLRVSDLPEFALSSVPLERLYVFLKQALEETATSQDNVFYNAHRY